MGCTLETGSPPDGRAALARALAPEMAARFVAIFKPLGFHYVTLDLEGYRANSVAYAMAWLAEKTGHRIDLNKVWAEQRLSLMPNMLLIRFGQRQLV